MKTSGFLLALLLTIAPKGQAQTNGAYVNYIIQNQLPSGVVWDMSGLAANGQRQSELPINPGGARFELFSLNTLTGVEYLLDSRYVASYVPIGGLTIRSEDPYDIVPRTRADRPFFVDVLVEGLLSGPADPEAAKKVNFLRHVQSYGVGGTGIGIDRTQAMLLSQNYVEANGTSTLSFAINAVPGADRSKIRGEERFSLFSLEDKRTDMESGLEYTAPSAQLASQFIQIWPVADGALAGITDNQFIRYKLPPVTITLNDLYPDSHTYAQVYKGSPQLGVTGTIVPGSSLVINDTVPQNRILALADYDEVFTEDGKWTMELLTKTPFGIDRLAYVTFDVDRVLEMNGTVTTIAD